MRHILWFFCLLLLGCSNPCEPDRGVYANNESQSDENGNPFGPTVNYFSLRQPLESSDRQNEMVISRLLDHSNVLYDLNEPILYNFYLCKEIYRFLWLRAFENPTVIEIIKDQGKIWLITKIIEYPLIEGVDSLFDKDGSLYEVNEYQMKSKKGEIVLDTAIELSRNEWRRFEKLLNKTDHLNEKQIDFYGPVIDGSYWVLEWHLKNKYWFIERYHPDSGSFKDACKYLISLSLADKENIY
jgi:hypothetical protein